MDKFYTVPDVAQKCIDTVSRFYDWNVWDIVIEPSAGNGSFSTLLPTDKLVALDIMQQDFLTWSPQIGRGNILVIGNPLFGRVSSMAIKFFNHSARWCAVIAFILPRTFRRVSIQNKLDPYFHLEYDEDIQISPCAFDPPMMAKCCFQIWKKTDIKRDTVELPLVHNDWIYLGFGHKDANGQPTPPEGADFAIRAFGGKCGEIVRDDLDKLRPKSWHWIKSNIDKNELMRRFGELDYSVSLDTVRQNSIGKAELVKLYSDKFPS